MTFPKRICPRTRSPTGTGTKLLCHLPRNKAILVGPVSGLTFTQTAFPAKASGKMVESPNPLGRMLTVAGAAQAVLTFASKNS